MDRLTKASYSGGNFYLYTYDEVGNRLTETTPAGTTNYVYYSANRLTTVGGVSYSWDNNGNLLSDGVNMFTYDHANRLSAVTNPQSGVMLGFTYNGFGDRLSSTVNGVTTNYTLDLAAGLSQVLQDNTYTYLYGNERIGQERAGGMEYFQGDALGSVRKIANQSGVLSLSKNYQPFGEILSSAGIGVTHYGYTGEWRDNSTKRLPSSKNNILASLPISHYG